MSNTIDRHGMQKVNPEDPFIVEIDEGSLGIDRYSSKTEEGALQFAIAQHLGHPKSVQVFDRAENIVITKEQTAEKFGEYCQTNGIKMYVFEVDVALKPK